MSFFNSASIGKTKVWENCTKKYQNLRNTRYTLSNSNVYCSLYVLLMEGGLLLIVIVKISSYSIVYYILRLSELVV